MAELDAEWTAALADAKIARDRTRLYVSDGETASDGTTGAAWHPPGEEVARGCNFPAPHDLGDANDPAHKLLHRIVIWRGSDVALVGARLRHELEHARQWDSPTGEAVFRLYLLARDHVLPFKAGGLEGCLGGYINALPVEHDANAAAAMYLRDRHKAAIPTILASDHRQLACSCIPAEPLDTLPMRMVAFLAQFPGPCEAYKQTQQPALTFADLLEWRCRGAGDLWRALTSAELG